MTIKNLIDRISSSDPSIKISPDGSKPNSFILTFSGESNENVYSTQISETRGIITLGQYILKRGYGEKLEDAVFRAISGIQDAVTFESRNNKSSRQVAIAAKQAYASYTAEASFVSQYHLERGESAVHSSFNESRTPLINNKFPATHRVNPSLLPERNLLFHASSGPDTPQTVSTIDEFMEIPGVTRIDGNIVQPWAKPAKGSRLARKNLALEVIDPQEARGTNIIEHPGVSRTEQTIGRGVIHPFFVPFSSPGAGYLPKEEANKLIGKPGTKSQRIDIGLLRSLKFEVTSGKIQRGTILARFGDGETLVSDQNAEVIGARILVPMTKELESLVLQMKEDGVSINQATGLPYNWQYAGVGSSAQIVYDVNRYGKIGQMSGVSVKRSGHKSYDTLYDTSQISEATNRGYHNPNVESSFESIKGAIGPESIGLILGSPQYREKALEEIAKYNRELSARLSGKVTYAQNYRDLSEASEILFYKRDWTPDLPFGGVQREYHANIGVSTRDRIPALVQSYLDGDGRAAVNKAIELGLAPGNSTVKLIRNGAVVFNTSEEILANRDKIKEGDLFQFFTAGRSVEYALPQEYRGVYSGRKPRFSGDELALQAHSLPKTVDHIIDVTREQSSTYRSIIALSRGGQIPKSRVNDVFRFNDTDDVYRQYEEKVTKYAKESGLALKDFRRAPVAIKARAIKEIVASQMADGYRAGSQFIQLNDHSILEPIDEIMQLGHTDLSGKERAKVVLTWFRSFESGMSDPNQGGKTTDYVSHEQQRRFLAGQEGFNKSATSAYLNAENERGRILGVEGAYQIQEQIPAGMLVAGSDVMRQMYSKFHTGKFDRKEFNEWQRRVFEDSLALGERRPGVDFLQGGQVFEVIPQIVVSQVLGHLGLKGSQFDRGGIYVSGGISFATPQSGDSDEDRMVIAIMENIKYRNPEVYEEMRKEREKILQGRKVLEIARARYSAEFNKGMSPEAAALLGGDSTQLEMAKQAQDPRKWLNWAKKNTAKFRRMDGSMMTEDPDPMTKLFLPYEMSEEELASAFKRYAQHKNTDVGWNWIFSATSRFASEELFGKGSAKARGVQSSWAANYQAALDSDIIWGQRMTDMAKTMTLGERIRPGGEITPGSGKWNQIDIETIGYDEMLLPEQASETGLIRNLALNAIQEFRSGTTTPGIAAMRISPIGDDETHAKIAEFLSNASNNEQLALNQIINTLTGVGKEKIYKNTLAGRIIMLERSRSWLKSDSFNKQEPWMQEEIRRSAPIMNAIRALSGEGQLTEKDLVALSQTPTSYGQVASGFIQDFATTSVLRAVPGLRSAFEAQNMSRRSADAFFASSYEVFTEQRSVDEPLGKKPSESYMNRSKMLGTAGSKSRSPSQLGRSTEDIIFRNLFPYDKRSLLWDTDTIRSIARGDLAGGILESYLKKFGYTTQTPAIDLPGANIEALIKAGYGTGTVDLFYMDKDGNRLISDIKTTRSREFNRQLGKQQTFNGDRVLAPAHRWGQVGAYMTGSEDVTRGSISYLDAESMANVKANTEGGQTTLGDIIESIMKRNPVSKYGTETINRNRKDIQALVATGLNIDELGSNLEPMLKYAAIPSVSAVHRYARDYYERVNGIFENLVAQGKIPREVKEDDPEYQRIYREIKSGKDVSHAEASMRAFQGASRHYFEIYDTEASSLGIPSMGYKDMAFLKGTPLENDHRVLIELPGKNPELANQYIDVLTEMMREAGAKNPIIIHTSGKDREVLEFSVPSKGQQSKSHTWGETNWENWLKQAEPVIRRISRLASFNVHSPANISVPDPLSTVKSLRSRYNDLLKINPKSPGVSLDSINTPEGSDWQHAQSIVNTFGMGILSPQLTSPAMYRDVIRENIQNLSPEDTQSAANALMAMHAAKIYFENPDANYDPQFQSNERVWKGKSYAPVGVTWGEYLRIKDGQAINFSYPEPIAVNAQQGQTPISHAPVGPAGNIGNQTPVQTPYVAPPVSSNVPPPPIQPIAMSSQSGNQAHWWSYATTPYTLDASGRSYAQVAGQMAYDQLNGGFGQKVGRQAVALGIASKYSQLQRLESPSTLLEAEKYRDAVTGLMRDYNKEYEVSTGTGGKRGGASSTLQAPAGLDTEGQKLRDLSSRADGVVQAFTRLEDATKGLATTIDEKVAKPLRDTILDYAEKVQSQGLSKNELVELYKARDSLSLGEISGSGQSKALRNIIDRTIGFQAAMSESGDKSYVKPDEVPRKSGLKSEVKNAFDDMAFGMTAFRIRMGVSLATGNQNQWMKDYLNQQQQVAQGGLMLGFFDGSSSMSRAVEAQNRIANRQANFGEGVSQVLLPLQSSVANVGGGTGVGVGTALLGYPVAAGMTAGYISNSLGSFMEKGFGGRVSDWGSSMQRNSTKIGGGVGLIGLGILGLSYATGEAPNWKKYEPQQWSSIWRRTLERDVKEQVWEEERESASPMKRTVMDIVRALNFGSVGMIGSQDEIYERARQEWLKTGEGKTWAAEQQMAERYPEVDTGQAMIASAYLARQVGEPGDNLATGNLTPQFAALEKLWMNYTSAGLSYEQIADFQGQTAAAQSVMPNTQRAMDWYTMIGSFDPSKVDEIKAASKGLSYVPSLYGRQATKEELEGYADFADYYGTEEEARYRFAGQVHGTGSMTSGFQISESTGIGISSIIAGRFAGTGNFRAMQSYIDKFQTPLGPSFQRTGVGATDATQFLLDFADRMGSDRAVEAQMMTVTAENVSLGYDIDIRDLIKEFEGYRNQPNPVPLSSLDEAALQVRGKAGIAPYGMAYGSAAAALWESQVSTDVTTQMRVGPASAILRSSGLGKQYSISDLDRVIDNIGTYGMELSKVFEDMSQGITDSLQARGYYANSSASTALTSSAMARFSMTPGANNQNLLASPKALSLLNAMVQYGGSVPSTLADDYSILSATNQAALNTGSLTYNQYNTAMESAGMTTPLSIAQSFANTGFGSSVIQPNGMPGMQTVDHLGLQYGQYTPWVNIPAMVSGTGKSLQQLIALYKTRNSYPGGGQVWSDIQSAYTEAPMYEQQQAMQIAQIQGQMATSGIEYNATFGGGGYYGSANFARRLQYGFGPTVTPTQVYNERMSQMNAWRESGSDKPFEFNPQMGQSTVSIAQEEAAIRRQMSVQQVQWRKEDLQMALQNLAIQRQQLQLSKQEAEIRREQSIYERESQRGLQLTQRSWQETDWAKNRQRFGIEAQWQDEDMARSIRFSTGRERVQLLRERDRTQIRRGWQSNDMAENENRQRKAWTVEDDRYNKSIQFEEQLWAIQQQRYGLQQQALDLQEQGINRQLGRIEEQQMLQEELWKLEDERFAVERDQFEENLKKNQEIYNVRMGILAKEIELAQTQAANQAGIIAGLTLQNEIAGKISSSDLVLGSTAIINMINSIIGAYGALRPPSGNGNSSGSTDSGRAPSVSQQIPLSMSNNTQGNITVQLVLDGDVIVEKTITPERLRPVVHEIQKRDYLR